MKHILLILSACIIFTACKTSEANYRAAYEKAVSTRDSDDISGTVYGSSRKLSQTVVVTGKDTVNVNVRPVSVLEESGATAESLKAYNVVVGQFKQKFNAMSLCQRWRDSGYPGTFVVQTSEPYYYIVIESFQTAAEARMTLEQIKQKSPIAIREPAPFILLDPRKK